MHEMNSEIDFSLVSKRFIKFRTIIVSFRNHVGIILGSFGNRFGITLVSFWDHVWIVLESF